MEFLVLLHPVLIIIFTAVSSVVLAFLLQQGEDVIDSAFSQRVVSQTIYQLPVWVPKSPCGPVFTGSVLEFASIAGPAIRQQAAPVSGSSCSFHSMKNRKPLHLVLVPVARQSHPLRKCATRHLF